LAAGAVHANGVETGTTFVVEPETIIADAGALRPRLPWKFAEMSLFARRRESNRHPTLSPSANFSTLTGSNLH
jgi:hypothetical protein